MLSLPEGNLKSPSKNWLGGFIRIGNAEIKWSRKSISTATLT